MGGDIKNPAYREVCTGRTGHAETIEVIFDPTQTDYETLAKLFFEIFDPTQTDYETLAKLFFETHDPTQVNRQGPDIGTQYRSAIFYTTDAQKATAEKLIGILKQKGYDVQTTVEVAPAFYPAEEYHQHYYQKKGGTPYCHIYQKKF